MLPSGENMRTIQRKAFPRSVSVIVTLFIASHVSAEETIIEQKKIPFEKCLNVITTSQDKLSLAPEITDDSEQKRVAVFTLADGNLTITCDGVEGNVTVSTKTN